MCHVNAKRIFVGVSFISRFASRKLAPPFFRCTFSLDNTHKKATMPRGENYLITVFRRLGNSPRDLTKSGNEDDKAGEEKPDDNPTCEARDKVKEESKSDTLDPSQQVIGRAFSFYEGDEEVPLKEEALPEVLSKAQKQQAVCNDTLDAENPSELPICSDRWYNASIGVNNIVDLDALDSNALGVMTQVDKPKVWTSNTIGLGWTPGRVNRVDKNRFRVEAIVALTDALEDIRLDECLAHAMAGKRGSFSSEISIRTESSEGSEKKRARIRSVFRSDGVN